MPKSSAYISVNGQYRNDKTKLGQVIADVMELDPAHMQTSVLRHRMNMLKNTAEGRDKMGDALERYIQRYAEDKTRKLLLGLVRKGALSLKDAAESLSVSEAELQMELDGNPDRSPK